jgi:hypothetical protein
MLPHSGLDAVSNNCTKLFCIGSDTLVPFVSPAIPVTGHSSDQDLSFIDLLNAYRPYGGVSRVNDLPAGLRVTCAGQDQSVSDLVCNGDLFAFSWHDDLWIPMFQFDMPDLTISTGPHRAVVNLGPGFDGWALARWFIEPNPWLNDDSAIEIEHTPIECLGSRLADVLDAARAHYFAERG